jgi:hypothetical protein
LGDLLLYLLVGKLVPTIPACLGFQLDIFGAGRALLLVLVGVKPFTVWRLAFLRVVVYFANSNRRNETKYTEKEAEETPLGRGSVLGRSDYGGENSECCGLTYKDADFLHKQNGSDLQGANE